MNDLSVASRFISNSPDLSVPLAGLCEASARAAELVSSMPSLREAVRTLAGAALLRAKVNYNPDILFLNRRTMEGSLSSSVSLTDAVVRTLIDGVDIFDNELIAIYTRHDSVDERFLAHHTDTQGLKRIFTFVRNRLSPLYIEMLEQFWSEQLSAPVDGQSRLTRQQAWAFWQSEAFRHAGEISFLNGEIEARDKDRLEPMLLNAGDGGVYQILLDAQGEPSALLHSAFVITLEPQAIEALNLENYQGALCLLTPVHGVEKFVSLSHLNTTLRERFANSGERATLIEDLSLRQAGQFSQRAEVEFRYSRCTDPLAHALVTVMQARQVDDFSFLLADAGQSDIVSRWLEAMNRCQSLEWLDTARHINVRTYMQSQQTLSMPYWLKYASESDRDSHDAYASQYRRRADNASQLLKGMESLEAYALDRTDGYIHLHLGYTVDPRKVFITLQDKWPSPLGDMKPTYRKSLFDYALDGLPGTETDDGARVDLPVDSQHPAFSLAFVKNLVLDLDLRRQYQAQRQARYQSPEVQRAFFLQRDSMIALSAWSAKMQGHFLIDSNGDENDRSLELIRSIRGDVRKPGATFSIGSLDVGWAGNRLRDVIVFREQTETDEHYVLYAPGAPGGRDMLEFKTWTALYHEVAQWSKKPAGIEYILKQTPARYREACHGFMQKVNRKPLLWKREHVIFSPCPELDFGTNLTAINNEKIKQDLDESAVDLYLDRPRRYISQLALVNARIDWLERGYQQSMELISYARFARAQGQAYISDALKRRGINQIIDPDTVYFDLDSDTPQDDPDLDSDTSLISLTHLIMDDFSYSLSDTAPMYSSTGQDLSNLSREIITGVLKQYTGERYIDLIKDKYQKDKKQVAGRRALFAQRQYYSMYKDILLAYLTGQHDETRFRQLLQILGTLFPGGTGASGGSINLFRINGNLVEGVFLFKVSAQPDSGHDLVYTPNAPDGIRFRSQSECAESLLYEDMQRYYYERVSYKRQRVMGTLFDDLWRQREATLEKLYFDGAEKIKDLTALHDSLIERIILDVDQQSLSSREELAEVVWGKVRKVVGILLKPFPPAAAAWNVLVAFVDFTRGYLAYLDGDRATATDFYISGMSSLISGYKASRKIGKTKGDKKQQSHDLSGLINWVQKQRAQRPANGLPSHGVTGPAVR